MATWRSRLGSILRVIVLCGTFAGLTLALLSRYYGALSSARQALAGADLVVRPAAVDVGSIGKAARLPLELIVTNVGEEPITMIGVSGACECELHPRVPFAIETGEARAVYLLYDAPQDAGEFQTFVQLVSTSTRTPLVPFRIEGVISR